MRRLSTIILAFCTFLFVSITSAQQTSIPATTTTISVPNLIRYSGTLKDAQSAALTSTAPLGVTFAIYKPGGWRRSRLAGDAKRHARCERQLQCAARCNNSRGTARRSILATGAALASLLYA
jgi:hypothetical protein